MKRIELEKYERHHVDWIDFLVVWVILGVMALASCAVQKICREVNIPGKKTKQVCSADWN